MAKLHRDASMALGPTGSSSVGGPSPAIIGSVKYCDSGALLCTSGRGERGKAPFLLLPSLLL